MMLVLMVLLRFDYKDTLPLNVSYTLLTALLDFQHIGQHEQYRGTELNEANEGTQEEDALAMCNSELPTRQERRSTSVGHYPR